MESLFSSANLPILMGILVIFLVFVAAANRRKTETLQLDENLIDWDAALSEEVQENLPNNAIAAIRAYRNITGIGLKESKDIIDYLMAHPEAGKGKRRVSAEITFSDAGIRDLLREGKTEEAVEAYKTFAGVDVFTAREAVEQIAQSLTEPEDSHENVMKRNSKQA